MLFRGENFGTWERFTVSFMQHLYLVLPSHSAYSPFYSSIYAEIRNPVARDRAASAEMSRSAVFFWWYVANTIRVLELLTRVLLIPYFSCILNVFLFFLWDFFSYALRIFLPNTVTLCKLCCPWDIQLRIQFHCIFLSDFMLESTLTVYDLFFSRLQSSGTRWNWRESLQLISFLFFYFFFRTTAARAKVVNDWVIEGGVLLMGYEMYRLLSLKKSFATGRKKKTKKQTGPVIIDLDEEDRQQELLKGGELGGGVPVV